MSGIGAKEFIHFTNRIGYVKKHNRYQKAVFTMIYLWLNLEPAMIFQSLIKHSYIKLKKARVHILFINYDIRGPDTWNSVIFFNS